MTHPLKDPFKIQNQKRVSPKGIKLTKEFKRQLFFRKVWSILGVVLFVGVVALAGAVVMSGPIKDTKGWIIPMGRESFAMGDVVVATDQTDSIGVRFKEAWISPDEIVIGKVIAGPHGVLSGKNGKYTVTIGENEVQSNISFETAREKFLTNEYIVRCESGTCEPGQDYLFRLGEVKGKTKAKAESTNDGKKTEK